MNKKVAAVTGSRRGIGLEIARSFAKAGYVVILSDIVAVGDAADAIRVMEEEGARVSYIRCNIASEEDRALFFTEVETGFGRLDVLVNNAGIAPLQRMDLLETTTESFVRLMQTNLMGTFFMCQMAANQMITMQSRGLSDYAPRIINIGSISSYTSSTNRGEYCISKAGVAMTTALFADRLAEYGICVFEVSPGIILTDMTAPVKEKYEQLIASGLTPIKRFGRPEDVADCVMAAAGGLLDFATGQSIHADGGFHIRRL